MSDRSALDSELNRLSSSLSQMIINKRKSTYPFGERWKNWLDSKVYNVNINEEVEKKVDNVRNLTKFVKKLKKLEIAFDRGTGVPELNEEVKKG